MSGKVSPVRRFVDSAFVQAVKLNSGNSQVASAVLDFFDDLGKKSQTCISVSRIKGALVIISGPFGPNKENEEVAYKIIDYTRNNDTVIKPDRRGGEINALLLKKQFSKIHVNPVYGVLVICPEQHQIRYVTTYEESTDCIDFSIIGVIQKSVSGGDMAEVLKKQKAAFPVEKIQRYAHQLFSSLCEIHEQGIIHRDLKDANILMCDQTDRALICDFGVSLKSKRSHSIVGDPDYMPPEQHYTDKGDVYASGLCVLKMATNSIPFNLEDDGEDIINGKKQRPIPELVDLKGLAPDLADFIRKTTQLDADKRPSATEALKHPFLLYQPIFPKAWLDMGY